MEPGFLSADSTEYVLISSSPSSSSSPSLSGRARPVPRGRPTARFQMAKDKALPPLPRSATDLHYTSELVPPTQDDSDIPLSPLSGLHLTNLSSPIIPARRVRSKDLRQHFPADIPGILDAAKRAALPKVQRVVHRVGRSIFPKGSAPPTRNSGPDLLFSRPVEPGPRRRSNHKTNRR